MFNEEQLKRYSRHFVLKGIGAGGQKRLLASKVIVIGAGALGSISIPYLAAAGVGTVGVADFDSVDISNLHRQILYGTSDSGKSKAETAAKKIAEINPDVTAVPLNVRVTCDNITDIICDYDFVVDATDRFETKFLINDACVLSGKPYSHAGVVRYGGQAMTYVPGKGPCLRCLLEDVPENSFTCSEAGVLGPCAGIIGSVQASECIKYLTGSENLLTGKVFTYDAETLSSRITGFRKNSSCLICSENAEIKTIHDRENDYVVKGCG